MYNLTEHFRDAVYFKLCQEQSMFAEEMAPLQPQTWMAFPFGQDKWLQRMTKCQVGEEEAKTLQNS